MFYFRPHKHSKSKFSYHGNVYPATKLIILINTTFCCVIKYCLLFLVSYLSAKAPSRLAARIGYHWNRLSHWIYKMLGSFFWCGSKHRGSWALWQSSSKGWIADGTIGNPLTDCCSLLQQECHFYSRQLLKKQLLPALPRGQQAEEIFLPLCSFLQEGSKQKSKQHV